MSDIVRLDHKAIHDLEMLDAQLRKVAREFDDFGGLWSRFEETMISVTEEWFASEGHGTWPPLAESTIKRKIAGGFPLDPLIRTGELLDSLTSSDAGLVEQGRTSLGTFGHQSFSWGTDVEYATYHQEGDEPRMPMRQPIEWPLNPTTEERLQEDANDYVEELLREAGVEA